MSRKPLYTVEHIDRVNQNQVKGHSVLDSIKLAGFSDSSCFYQTCIRLGYKERPRRWRKDRPVFSETTPVRGFM